MKIVNKIQKMPLSKLDFMGGEEGIEKKMVYKSSYFIFCPFFFI